MRLLHTSDWHLGKRLFEVSLLDDQAHVLAQIFDVCKAERVDVLVVAGDLYDRALPPVEAIELLGGFFERVAVDLKIPVVAISGNHDSAERLGFSADVLAEGRIHLLTRFDRRARPVVVKGVPIYGLPYLEPEQARARLGDEKLNDHAGAVEAALAAVRADRAERRARDAVLVAHLFAQGGRESIESERPLIVGGAVQVPSSVLGGWTYVALGHLHEPQAVDAHEALRYSGSILKYSFGEAAHRKSVSLVDFVCGRAAVREIPLTPRRDLVRIEAGFDELLREERFASAEGAFVQATYDDTGYVVEAAARLRRRFPHLLSALPRALVRQVEGEAPRRLEGAGGDARELLKSFWAYVDAEGGLADAHVRAFEQAIERAGREGGAECALAS